MKYILFSFCLFAFTAISTFIPTSASANLKDYYRQRLFSCQQYDAWCVGSILLDAIFDGSSNNFQYQVRFYGSFTYYPSADYCGIDKPNRGAQVAVVNMSATDKNGNLTKCASVKVNPDLTITSVEYGNVCLSSKTSFYNACNDIANSL